MLSWFIGWISRKAILGGGMDGGHVGLTDKQKEQAISLLNDFQAWLPAIGVPLEKCQQWRFEIAEASPADWTMRPDTQGGVAWFNPHLVDAGICSYEYFCTIIIHEAFHLLAHNIPHKSNAKHLRNRYAPYFMVYFDIEADVITARFFREAMGYSKKDYVSIMSESCLAFPSDSFEEEKLERFIGSLLSVVAMYQEDGKDHRCRSDIILPSFRPAVETTIKLVVSSDNGTTSYSLGAESPRIEFDGLVTKNGHSKMEIFSVDYFSLTRVTNMFLGKVAGDISSITEELLTFAESVQNN
jgi:hypothetical protein